MSDSLARMLAQLLIDSRRRSEWPLPPIPEWVLQELQEDLQDAATDLGHAYAGDPQAQQVLTKTAESRYNLASRKMSNAIQTLSSQNQTARKGP